MSAGRLSYTPHRPSSDRRVSVHSFSVAVLPLCRFRDRLLNSGVGHYTGHFTAGSLPHGCHHLNVKKNLPFLRSDSNTKLTSCFVLPSAIVRTVPEAFSLLALFARVRDHILQVY